MKHDLNRDALLYNDPSLGRVRRTNCLQRLHQAFDSPAREITREYGLSEMHEALFETSWKNTVPCYRGKKDDGDIVDFFLTFLQNRCILEKIRRGERMEMRADYLQSQKEVQACGVLFSAVMTLCSFPLTTEVSEAVRQYYPCFFMNDIGTLMQEERTKLYRCITEHIQEKQLQYEQAFDPEFLAFYTEPPAQTLPESLGCRMKQCCRFENLPDACSTEQRCGYPLKWFVFQQYAEQKKFQKDLDQMKRMYREFLLSPRCENADELLRSIGRKYVINEDQEVTENVRTCKV